MLHQPEVRSGAQKVDNFKVFGRVGDENGFFVIRLNEKQYEHHT